MWMAVWITKCTGLEERLFFPPPLSQLAEAHLISVLLRVIVAREIQKISLEKRNAIVTPSAPPLSLGSSIITCQDLDNQSVKCTMRYKWLQLIQSLNGWCGQRWALATTNRCAYKCVQKMWWNWQNVVFISLRDHKKNLKRCPNSFETNLFKTRLNENKTLTTTTEDTLKIKVWSKPFVSRWRTNDLISKP